jgi:protease PrsW
MVRTLKKFGLRVIIPSGFLVIVVTVLFSEQSKSNPQKRIEAALASGNSAVEKAEYRKLIQEDFFKVEYHIGYIRSHLSQPGQSNAPYKQDNHDLIEGYRRYAASSTPEVSDIGYYGLGLIYSLQDDYEHARENFLKVHNTQLSYLNSSLAAVYHRTGRFDLAKQHLDREIQLGGNVRGAYSNLAQLYYATKQYSELKKIAARPEATNAIPGDIRRFVALRERRYTDYVREASVFRSVTGYGLFGAVLTLVAWFVYVQQIDGFESKRFWRSGIVLAGGMIFSCFSVPLYDAFEFFVGFRRNGTYLNDLVYYVFVVGLIEEALKVVPVLLVMRLTGSIYKPIDYIIYGSMSALGFAFMENLLPGSAWRPDIISTRALDVGHMTYTSLILYGLFYARHRIQKNPLPYFLLAFVAASALHGISDFVAAKGWGVVAFLIAVYLIRQYGVFINGTLVVSERNPNQQKRQIELTEYLCYSLAAIVMLQYVVSAVNIGPSNTNSLFLWTLFISCFWLCVILINLGSFDIRKRQWLPLLRRKAIAEV